MLLFFMLSVAGSSRLGVEVLRSLVVSLDESCTDVSASNPIALDESCTGVSISSNSSNLVLVLVLQVPSLQS